MNRRKKNLLILIYRGKFQNKAWIFIKTKNFIIQNKKIQI